MRQFLQYLGDHQRVQFSFCTFRTINGFFGSLYVTSSGILLNNEMNDFSISTDANPNEVKMSNIFQLVHQRQQPAEQTINFPSIKKDMLSTRAIIPNILAGNCNISA